MKNGFGFYIIPSELENDLNEYVSATEADKVEFIVKVVRKALVDAKEKQAQEKSYAELAERIQCYGIRD